MTPRSLDVADFRRTFLEAKDGLPSQEARLAVQREFFSTDAAPNNYAVLAYGLLNTADDLSVSRALQIVESAIASGDDLLLKAALTIMLLYWDIGNQHFELIANLLSGLSGDEFDESLVVVSNWLAFSAYQSRSNDVLSLLKGRLLRAAEGGNFFEERILRSSLAVAVLGPRSTSIERQEVSSAELEQILTMRYE
jgi:hypothetical protein